MSSRASLRVATIGVFLSACGAEVDGAPWDGTESAPFDSVNVTSGQGRATCALTIRASGQLLQEVAPHVVVRVDGNVAAELDVTSTELHDYVVMAPGAADAQQIDVVFTNDASGNGEDRNLVVESLTIAGMRLLPSQPGTYYDVGVGNAAFDGVDVRTGQSTLYYSGALRFRLPNRLVVSARGSLLGGRGPHMQVRIDGAVAAELDVATTLTDFAVATEVGVGSAAVDVVFTNDAWNPVTRVDRNLYVTSVRLGGHEQLPTGPGVVYDVGGGAAAFDGQNLLPGTDSLLYSGALRFTFTVPGTAPAAAFTATPDSGIAPLTVQLVSTSTGAPSALAWDVDGDGEVDATTATTSHTFTTPGIYVVTLTATNDAGSDSTTKTVRVNAGPTAPLPNLLGRRLAVLGYSPGELAWRPTDATADIIARYRLYFNGFYHDDITHTMTRDLMAKVRARNPNTIALIYDLAYEMQPTNGPKPLPNHAVWDEVQGKVESTADKSDGKEWFLHTVSGGRVYWPTNDAYGARNINLTGGARQGRDRNNEQAPEALARIYQRYLGIGTGTHGYFHDNAAMQQQGQELTLPIDYFLDGTGHHGNEPAVVEAFHQGMRRFVRSLQARDGAERIHVGNMLSGYDPFTGSPAYEDLWHGAMWEYAFGPQFAADTDGARGWNFIMNRARTAIAATKAPHLVMLNTEVRGIVDLAVFRYTLASVLLEDYLLHGYRAENNSYMLFDEYFARLGDGIGDPPRAATQDGIWYRAYEGGAVLVNPSTNKCVRFAYPAGTLTRSGSTVTLTGVTHGLTLGEHFRLAGTPSTLRFNGIWQVTAVHSPTSVSWASCGPQGTATNQYGYVGRASTIQLPTGKYRRIGASDPRAGAQVQDPVVNNGQNADSVTLFAPDGLILLER